MTIEVEGLKDTLRLLQKIDPTLRREFGKRIRQIAQPMVDEIEKVRPPKTGFPRGFQHGGRTGSGAVKKIKINTNTRRARARNITAGAQYETIGTVRVMTADAASAIADMAGKPGNISMTGRSRSYPGRPQGHALNGQGAGLIRGLNKYMGAPSRFMWKNADPIPNTMEREFLDLIAEMEDEINKELMKIGSTANEIRALQRRR
jgi:hypothetical protein